MSSKDQVLQDIHVLGANINSREIYLHSFYGAESESFEAGVDYRQATTFVKNLNFLDSLNDKCILIHMHSQGGNWDDGMAMFNAIQFAKSYTTILAYSQASSMSGILLQAADLRVMMPDCHFMMHYGSYGGSDGHPHAMKNGADFQMKACKRMIEVFASRAMHGPFFQSKKTTTKNSVCQFFHRKLKQKIDWYLDAEEAVYYGLSDNILGDEEYPDIASLK